MSSRAVVAEGLGTALLLTAVVGSGVMGERLAGGNVAIALLANAAATGAALIALIMTLGSVSGAHFNPLVSAGDVSLSPFGAAAYVLAQLAGACAGVMLAHVMFGEPLLQISRHVRSGWPLIVGEAVATFGLLSVIRGTASVRPSDTAWAVGAYITGAYWFTSSTSFANPAVTVARALTDTFAGIRPADVPGFLVGQGVGAVAATVFCRWLFGSSTSEPECR